MGVPKDSTVPPLPSMNLSDILFPVPPPSEDSPLTHQNHMRLRSLFRCIEHRNCHKNQTQGWRLHLRKFGFTRLILLISCHLGFPILS
jgi:hypothetical protein